MDVVAEPGDHPGDGEGEAFFVFLGATEHVVYGSVELLQDEFD